MGASLRAAMNFSLKFSMEMPLTKAAPSPGGWNPSLTSQSLSSTLCASARSPTPVGPTMAMRRTWRALSVVRPTSREAARQLRRARRPSSSSAEKDERTSATKTGSRSVSSTIEAGSAGERASGSRRAERSTSGAERASSSGRPQCECRGLGRRRTIYVTPIQTWTGAESYRESYWTLPAWTVHARLFGRRIPPRETNPRAPREPHCAASRCSSTRSSSPWQPIAAGPSGGRSRPKCARRAACTTLPANIAKRCKAARA